MDVVQSGWTAVTHGCTATEVRRSPSGDVYTKTALGPNGARELADERDRLEWLAETDLPAARVVDWTDGEHPTLVTSAVPGAPLSSLVGEEATLGFNALVEAIARLHDVDPATCPFDRRLQVTIAQARVRTVAGDVDESDFDGERSERTAASLLIEVERDALEMSRREAADLVVCHGDACLPNIIVDPVTFRLAGIVDVGRLGVADRHWDLALAARSTSAADLNPGFGPQLAVRLLTDARWADRVDHERIAFYQLLDEFF